MNAKRRNLSLGIVAVLVVLVLAWAWSRPASTAREDSNAEAGSERLAAKLGEGRKQATPTKLDLGRAAKAAIRGTIRDEQGAAIEGAQVCARPNLADLQGRDVHQRRCARSGADGYYRIDGLWPVRTRVDASAPTFKPNHWEIREGLDRWRRLVPLQAGQTREGVDITLEAGGVQVFGVIRDIAGGEIEGAQVAVRARRGASPAAVTVSDEQGKFEVWAEPGSVLVDALAEGYSSGELRGVAPGQFLELFLTPESVLVGTVVLADSGEPVADALVSTYTAEARTDGDGRFRLEGLEPGVYKPAAKTDTLYGQAVEQVHLGLGQTSEPVVIRVHPAASIEARVVIAGSERRPCPDGWVRLQPKAGYGEGKILDDDGQAEFHGVIAGTYKVQVTCRGYIAEEHYPDLEVGEDSLAGLVWEVREGQAIRGEIVDPTGAPLQDASVRVRPLVDPEAAAGTQLTSSNTSSERDGSFTLTGLLPGRYELTAYHRGRAALDDPLVLELEPGVDLTGVRLVMPAGGSVRGRVVDERGVPMAKASIRAVHLDANDTAEAQTNDAGEFELPDLRPGKVRVTASDTASWWTGTVLRKPGTRDDDPQGEVVEVIADELVEVVITVEARDGTITGTVRDESGAPVADAFVDIERMSEKSGSNARAARQGLRWSWGRQPVLTDEDGRFEFTALSEGKFLIHANRKGGGEAVAEAVPLGAHVELVITRTGELAGAVRLADGGAPERFTIVAYDRAAGLHHSDTCFRTEGAWRLREVPAGSYEISVTAVEGSKTLDDVELGEGEIREAIELTLEPRVTIRGRLVDLDTREPVAGFEVFTSGSRVGVNADDRRNVTGSDGRFEIEGVLSGSTSIMARSRGAASQARYGTLWKSVTLDPQPLVQDVGDLELVARRLAANEQAGDLGYEINQWDPSVKPEDVELRVALVRPGGPAAGTGLAAGDVIEKVDGHDVLGIHGHRYSTLSSVPEGTVVKLELRGGKLVEITAGPPFR